MELISLSVCDLNTNKGSREPTVSAEGADAGKPAPLRPLPHNNADVNKKHSIYYNMSHTKTLIIETNNENINDVSSVVVKPTIAQQWVKIGGESYQSTKPKKNKKIVPNNDNIQTGLWD
jgi:hypothetical protein